MRKNKMSMDEVERFLQRRQKATDEKVKEEMRKKKCKHNWMPHFGVTELAYYECSECSATKPCSEG